MALRNRQSVLEAATARFCERGWAASVRDIARAAGVSVETVYAHFGSRVDLLNEVLDVAVVGDDAPVALVDRPEFAALSAGSRREQVLAAAALNTSINQRTPHCSGPYRRPRPSSRFWHHACQVCARASARRSTQGTAMVTGREVTATQADGLGPDEPGGLRAPGRQRRLEPCAVPGVGGSSHHRASPPPRLKGEGHDHEQA